MYKLNGGKGAIVCNKCHIIIKAPAPEIWRELLRWGEIHYCNLCHPLKVFKRELEKFLDEEV